MFGKECDNSTGTANTFEFDPTKSGMTSAEMFLVTKNSQDVNALMRSKGRKINNYTK